MKHEPFIPPQADMRELTVRAVATGVVLGVIFGASSLYLALKVGLTVSASIPVAVISLALFRSLSRLGLRDATILEHNITQTAGSSGESLAFGVGVTMPAILVLGFDLEIVRVMTVAVLGGFLGILMMIPLRRALIVREHGILKYPEGTACAAVLEAGATEADFKATGQVSDIAFADRSGGKIRDIIPSSGGKVIFTGFAVGLLYKVLNVAFKGWRDVPEKVFGAPFRSASVSAEISPELLGVGYIIGPRIGSIMCAGGVLAYLVLIPMIKFFGERISGPLAPGLVPIAAMDPGQIRGAYVLYIGAGAVAAGGIISLLRSLPMIWRAIRGQVSDRAAGAIRDLTPLRTDRDLPMKFVVIGIIGLMAAITAVPALHMNVLGALLIVVFGFLFVTVSSRLTGELGNSSNPVSGMTVATLLLTCLVFLLVGWTGGTVYVTALSVGAIVCVAATNAGATSQDLKTGYLLGATPRFQQIAILCGSFASALTLGPILLKLNDSATVYVPIAQVAPAGLRADVTGLSSLGHLTGPQARDDGNTYRIWHKTDSAGGPEGEYFVDPAGRAAWFVDPGINGTFTHRPDGSEVRKFNAPKATLMSYIIKGILGHQLPWALVLLGVMIAITLEMAGIPSLAFAVGVYLPLSSSTPIFIGGLVRGFVDWRRRRQPSQRGLTEAQHIAEGDRSPGVLIASGYIAGGAIAGIAIAFLAGALVPLDTALTRWSTAHNPFFDGAHADALSLLPFVLLTGLLYLVARGRLLSSPKPD